MGLKILDKSAILSLEPPFIVHTVSDFVVVEYTSGDEIRFIERGKKIKISLEEFFKVWTGNTLVAESVERSKEPGYKINFRKEIFHNLRKIATLLILLFLDAFAFIINESYSHMGIVLLQLISFTGVYIGYQLVLKQLHIQSDYADKLCSLFKYSDCNSVLESDASKFLGLIGWSEIGLGYFVSNVVILSFLPFFIPSLLLINIFCLPYSFWSIWYQKFRAKQ